ncbi:MAG: exo-alpha-sialidase [Gemmataceae bacterium]|nr:exo-alpha-sialidase [Gemmataceae bacterium]
MFIEAQGLIRDATAKPDAERIAFFTALCPLASGTILCGVQVGRSKHAPSAAICLCRSRDRGNTWQELPVRFNNVLDGIPGSFAAVELVEAEPGRLLLFTTWFDRSDPARPLFDPVTEGLLRSRQLMTVSADEGDSWAPWTLLNAPGLTGCAMTGPAIRLAGGAIAYAFESFKEYDDPQPSRHGSWLLVSRDGGRSFGSPFLVAQDPQHKVYYWDQRLCPTPLADEFIALFWTHDRELKRDRNVHFLRASLGNTIAQLPQETSIPGQIAAPLLLDDGSLLAFVVDRGRPGTMKLWRSHDGGLTWPEQDCLVVHVHDERAALSQGKENIDYAQLWEDMGKWSFGHPAIRPLGPGRVLLAFYAGTPDRMSIHWARVATKYSVP